MKTINKIMILAVLLTGMPLCAYPVVRGTNEASPFFHYMMARLYMAEGRYLDAIGELENSIKLDPHSLYLREEILPLYFDLGDFDKARITAEEMLKMDPGHHEAHIFMAQVHRIRKEYALAEEEFRKALESKENALVYYQIGEMQMGQGRKDEAEKYLAKAVAAEPENLYYHIRLAQFFEEVGRSKEALNEYEKVLRLQPKALDILLEAAKIHLRLENNAEAELYFRKTLEQDPDNFAALFALSKISEQKKEWQKMSDYLSRIDLVKDDLWEVKVYLGYARLKLKDAAQAEKYFGQAERLDPQSSSKFFFMGLSYVEESDFAKAEPYLSRARGLSPGDSEILFYLGLVYDELDRDGEMEEILNENLSRNPGHAATLNYLAYYWADRKRNLDEALSYVLKALEPEPDNGAYLDTLGWVYFRKEDYKKALSYIEKASELLSDPVIWEHLGDVHSSLGNIKKAQKAYQKALETEPRNREEIEKKIEALPGH
ncbi:MAG TPA: tetratricopeptide repeat protein [bacterium]|nr:tetratricopeptide repeat protein [bacterium]